MTGGTARLRCAASWGWIVDPARPTRGHFDRTDAFLAWHAGRPQTCVVYELLQEFMRPARTM